MVIDYDRLPPDVREYVNAKVKEGAYPSIEAMLVHAVRRTRREKEELQARLAAAEASLARGEGRVITEQSMRQLAEDVKERGCARLAAEKKSS